ncbi:MAG: T9SS type A sorting domain-containing protein [Candidatus Eisenbacteria bacterium]|nr:T9SS type A sorting domain-containing protein [Candidatus Eisenbacteria bacterium]
MTVGSLASNTGRCLAVPLLIALAMAPPVVGAAAGEIQFEMPYQGPASPSLATLESPTSLLRVDLYLLFDSTGSMDVELAVMKDQLPALVDVLSCAPTGGSCTEDADCSGSSICFGGSCVEDPLNDGCIPDIWTGVGIYDECDTYTNLIHLQEDVAATAAAIPGTGGGSDEAPLQALACTADPGNCAHDPACSSDPEVDGGAGCPGFRPDAFRILLHYTDADNQSGPACSDIGIEEAGGALSGERIRYAGLIGDADDSPDYPGTPLQMAQQIAIASGSLNASSEPYVYAAVDEQVAGATQTAVAEVVTSFPSEVTLAVEDDPGDGFDATLFVDYIETNTSGGACTPGLPTSDSDGDGHGDTYPALIPGTPVCWDIVPVAENQLVPAADEDQIFTATLVARADGSVVHESALVFIVPGEGTSGMDAEVSPARIALLAPRPNPAHQGATLLYDLPSAVEKAVLRVVSPSGRTVRVLSRTPAAAGRHSLVWDGRDAGGKTAPPGIYFIRLEAGETTRTRKLNLLH